MARLNYLRFAKNFALNNFSFGQIYAPLNAQIELTMNCNGRCTFCSIWKPEFKKELKTEMTTREICHIIDELHKLGVQVLNFTGGEPTLRKDLPIILDYAASKGIMPTVATNGYNLYELVSEGKMKNAEWIMVSLDWPDAERHNRYRGIPIYDKAIKGIKAAVLERKTILISMVVTTENIGLMEEMCKLSHRLGAMIEMLPCENIIREQDSVHTVQEIDALIPDLHEYAAEIRRLVKIYPNIITDTISAEIIEAGGFGNQRLLHCVTAKSFVVINYQGEVVFPCKIHPVMKIDVRRRSLYDIYYSYETKKIIDMKDRFPFCKGCRLGCAIATSIPTRWPTLYEKYIKAFFNGNLF